MVTNIAESVANEIELTASYESARIAISGRCFAEYFIENQSKPETRMTTWAVASAAAVRSHVILGVGRPPDRIAKVGGFHPGTSWTSTIDYFYQVKQLDSEMKSEKIFKYRDRSRRARGRRRHDRRLGEPRSSGSKRDEETIRGLVDKWRAASWSRAS
jgi:hypothetical protein